MKKAIHILAVIAALTASFAAHSAGWRSIFADGNREPPAGANGWTSATVQQALPKSAALSAVQVQPAK